jgi:glycosyltransferase involved in cell wall biosynthesis
VLLFPSLHDESPLTVAEALALGLPVLCLDHGGPPVVARAVGSHVKAVPLRERNIPKALARALELGDWELPPVSGLRTGLSLASLWARQEVSRHSVNPRARGAARRAAEVCRR